MNSDSLPALALRSLKSWEDRTHGRELNRPELHRENSKLCKVLQQEFCSGPACEETTRKHRSTTQEDERGSSLELTPWRILLEAASSAASHSQSVHCTTNGMLRRTGQRQKRFCLRK